MTGTITYTVVGGTSMSVPYFIRGFAGGGVAATDVYLFGAMSGVAVGDIVVLNAGTLTTNADFQDAPPASGSYPTFLFDQDGNKLDVVDGISVPEPSTWVMIGASFALLVGILNHRLRPT